MTNREAIQILEEIETDVVLGGSWLFEGERGQDVLKTIELATQALEKQEPKKPICYQNNHLKSFCCPKCSKVVHSKYCSNCGQAIDWSE